MISHLAKHSELTKSLEYSQEHLDALHELGYTKSPVCKPYSLHKVIRFNCKRGVYWFSSCVSAWESRRFLIQNSVKSYILS